MAAGSRRLDVACTPEEAQDRHLRAVDRELAEAELRPASHAGLLTDELVDGLRREAAPPAFTLDQQRPVPAVSRRVRYQATEACAEDQCGRQRGNGDDGAGQRCPDRGTQWS